jgi:hypothetical protein
MHGELDECHQGVSGGDGLRVERAQLLDKLGNGLTASSSAARRSGWRSSPLPRQDLRHFRPPRAPRSRAAANSSPSRLCPFGRPGSWGYEAPATGACRSSVGHVGPPGRRPLRPRRGEDGLRRRRAPGPDLLVAVPPGPPPGRLGTVEITEHVQGSPPGRRRPRPKAAGHEPALLRSLKGGGDVEQVVEAARIHPQGPGGGPPPEGRFGTAALDDGKVVRHHDDDIAGVVAELHAHQVGAEPSPPGIRRRPRRPGTLPPVSRARRRSGVRSLR